MGMSVRPFYFRYVPTPVFDDRLLPGRLIQVASR
jgi:hypothetical protein